MMKILVTDISEYRITLKIIEDDKITEVNSAIVLQLLNNATKQNLKRILNSTSYMGTKRNVTLNENLTKEVLQNYPYLI